VSIRSINDLLSYCALTHEMLDGLEYDQSKKRGVGMFVNDAWALGGECEQLRSRLAAAEAQLKVAEGISAMLTRCRTDLTAAEARVKAWKPLVLAVIAWSTERSPLSLNEVRLALHDIPLEHIPEVEP
jgi:hypothetical protein